MFIFKSDFKSGIVVIKITDLEDLWYLSHIIDPGDLIKSKTTRKIKLGTAENAAVTKRTITVTIEAEDIDISADGNSLKINGKIKQGPEDVPLGSYQSISLENNSEFTLEKKHWLEYQKEKLKEAAEKRYNFLICILDREEALFALTKNFGYDILLKLKGEVQKKSKPVEIKKDFYLEIIDALQIYFERYKPENVILASPAFYKEDLFKKIISPELKKKIVLSTCSDVSEASLDEVIKRPELANTLKSSRTRKETLLIEELLSEINKNNLAAYGEKEVKKALDAGAVSKLILTTKFVSKQKTNGKFLELDQTIKQLEHSKGEIYIISSENEAGKRLDGIGGIAVILRYKLEW